MACGKATPDHTSVAGVARTSWSRSRLPGTAWSNDNDRHALVTVEDQAMLGVPADDLKVDEATCLGVAAEPQVAGRGGTRSTG